MNNQIFYFAYGSNMSIDRLKARINTAEFKCVAKLSGHKLKFHKISKKDGSGKCDAFHTEDYNDFIYGAVYSIERSHLKELDKIEGNGYGYTRKNVLITSLQNETINAQTYVATNIDPNLQPFDWYKEHVLRGAQAISLPDDYIAMINKVDAVLDLDDKRRNTELSIYNV